MKLKIVHWRFETGEPQFIGKSVIYPDGYREGADRGWYCWVYPDDNAAFVEWMDRICPKADVTFRFNSGDPMFTVHISDEKEAMLFQLAWNTQ